MAGIFSALDQKLSWLTQRMKVIAQNMSHANTPKYKTLELTPFEKTLAQKTQIKTTQSNKKHMSLDSGLTPAAYKTFHPETNTLSPSGNTVVETDELMKMTETKLQFDMMTAVYKKHITLYKMILGKNR